MKNIQPVNPDFKPEKLDAKAHFGILHGSHNQMVCIATNTDRTDWTNRFYHHHDVLAIIQDIAQDHSQNAYLSANGFGNSGKKTNENVTSLNAIFADIDAYSSRAFPAIADKAPEEVLRIILKKAPWLPVPTLLAHSGKGVYLVWVLEKPLPRSRLQEWQAVESLLVEALAKYGADRNAKDAARVLRLAGSANLKYQDNNKVSYVQIAEKIPFEKLKQVVLEHCTEQKQPEQTEQQPSQQPPKPDLVYTNNKAVKQSIIRKQFAIEDGTIKVFNLHTLAFARLLDLRTVAKLRAPLTDYRKRFLYLFAIETAQFYQDQKTREKEVLQFIYSFFENPENYAVKDVLNIISDKQNKRYFHSNQSIISILDINPFEQYTLKTLVSGPISYQRQLRKRREAGVKPKAEYLKQQNAEYTKRKQKALELRKQGLKQKEIAQLLKVDIRTVQKYLKIT